MVISEGNNNTKLTFAMGTTSTPSTSTSTSSSSKKPPPLHNFAMPPFLSWGTHKLLRCRKVDSDPTAENLSIGRQRKDDGGFDAVREKLMLNLQTEADKMKVAILDETAPLDGGRPWNLRTRRAACKAPNGGTSNGGDVKKPNFFTPSRTDDDKASRLLYGETYASAEKREREKFSVSLSRGEIEKDFMVMAGHKPHRRPKKRPKVVQKQLDSIFPGLWLTEVTADMYKVADAP